MPDSHSQSTSHLDLDTDALFEHEAYEHIDADSLDEAIERLVGRYPQAPIVALKADGVVTEMPPSIELRDNPVLQARSGLDLVIQEDRVRVLKSWDRLLSGGAARWLAHLASKPEETMAVFGVDLRERHGVVVTLFVPTGMSGASDEASSQDEPAGEPMPRFATIVKDERSFIVEIDEATTRILGWSAEEMVGHRSIEFMHPDDHALAIDNWMEMLASPGMGRRVRLRHRHRDGSWVWFEITNHNLLDESERRVVSDIVDISEEMAAHEALRAREQLLDRLAGAIPLGLFQIDAERRVVYTNERLHEILRVERAASVEEQLATVVESDRAAIERALTEVLETGRPQEVELEVSPPGRRERRLCAISLRALTHQDGVVSGAIACVSDVTDSARMRAELERRATFDELTECFNRAAIMRAPQADIDDRGAHGERAVMFVDVDQFKDVNDLHGHAAGDELLRVLSARLRAAVRERDLVGRLGGDEFLVVCPEVGGADCARALASRLAASLEAEVALSAARVHPRVSIGIAFSRGEEADGDELVARADSAMYDAKRGDGDTQVSATATVRRLAQAPRGERLAARPRRR
jgi:diguanylate cyclase (GGDEF)-like protein/PAS domain S-box-containing protein